MGNVQRRYNSPHSVHFRKLLTKILEFQAYYSEILFEISIGNKTPNIDKQYLVEFKQFLEENVKHFRNMAREDVSGNSQLLENDAFMLSNYIDVLSSSFVYKYLADGNLIVNSHEHLHKETTQICDHFKNRKNPLFLADSFKTQKPPLFLQSIEAQIGDKYNILKKLSESLTMNMKKIYELNAKHASDDILNNETVRCIQILVKKLEQLRDSEEIILSEHQIRDCTNVLTFLNNMICQLKLLIERKPNNLIELKYDLEKYFG